MEVTSTEDSEDELVVFLSEADSVPDVEVERVVPSVVGEAVEKD